MSVVYLGNLPVTDYRYHENGQIENVINVSVKLEYSTLNLQFMQTNQPNIYTPSKTPGVYFEAELDIANLCRLLTLLEIDVYTNGTRSYAPREFINLFSTKLASTVDFQKPLYIKLDDEYHWVIVAKNGEKKTFEIRLNPMNTLIFYKLLQSALKILESNQNISLIPVQKKETYSPTTPVPFIVQQQSTGVMVNPNPPAPITNQVIPPPPPHQF